MKFEFYTDQYEELFKNNKSFYVIFNRFINRYIINNRADLNNTLE